MAVHITYVNSRVGSAEGGKSHDIQLSGTYIKEEHCSFENDDGKVTIFPCTGALVYINGRQVTQPTELKIGARVILGKNHVFRFNHPVQGMCGGLKWGIQFCWESNEPSHEIMVLLIFGKLILQTRMRSHQWG